MIATPHFQRNTTPFVVPEAEPSLLSSVKVVNEDNIAVSHYFNGEPDLQGLTVDMFSTRVSRDSNVNLSPAQPLRLTNLSDIDRVVHQAGLDIEAAHEDAVLRDIQASASQSISTPTPKPENNE